MSTVWQEALDENARLVAKQAKEQEKEDTAVRMLKSGKLAIEEIATYSALSLAAVKNLAKAVALEQRLTVKRSKERFSPRSHRS